MHKIEIFGMDLVLSEGNAESLSSRFIEFIDASPRTVETYRRALRQFFKYLKLNNITTPKRMDIISFKRELAKTKKPATIQLYIIAVRQFFKWTAKEGAYPNIAENIKGARIDKEHKKDYLTSGQSREILLSINTQEDNGIRDYAILLLMLTTGLRTIEVVRANVEDMRNLGDNTVLFVQGKGREERSEYVKIAMEVERALRRYLIHVGPVKNGEPIFRSLSNQNKNQRLTTRSISGIVKKRLSLAGYNSDRLTAHSLRHTAVTLALLNGEKLEDVQKFARHASINTTLIYAHSIDMAKNSCASSVANAIFE